MKKHFVSRYKWSHDSKRKSFRRMMKAGKVKVIEKTHDGWVYEDVAG